MGFLAKTYQLHVSSTSLRQADKVNTIISSPNILPVWIYSGIHYKPGHDHDSMNMYHASLILFCSMSIFNQMFSYFSNEKHLLYSVLTSPHVHFYTVHCTQVLLPAKRPWVDRQGRQVACASRLNECMR